MSESNFSLHGISLLFGGMSNNVFSLVPYRVRNSAEKTLTTLITCDAHTGPTYTMTSDTSMFLTRNQSR